jgi:replicative DNA helicase
MAMDTGNHWDGELPAEKAARTAGGVLPPHDLDAERQVLGAMLLRNDAIASAKAIVQPAQFYHPAHAVICEGIYALDKAGQPVDVITLSNWLREAERLNTVGGGQYLGELTDVISTDAMIDVHAGIVSDLARCRAVLSAAQGYVSRCRGQGGYIVAMEEMVRSIADLSVRSGSREPKSFREVSDKFDAYLTRKLRDGNKIDGVATGFTDLDLLLGGLPNGLIILAARPSMGKSAFEFQAAVNIAETQGPVLCFSLEMSAVDKFAREVCGRSGAEFGLLRNGFVEKDLLDDVYKTINKLAGLRGWIQDDPLVTLDDVRAQTRRYKIKYGIKAAFVDYLQLMNAMMRRGMSRQEAVSEMSRGLKVLGQELEIPIIALSQLNRECEQREDKRPMLSDLRESGALEQDADVVLFIYRDEVYNKESPDKGTAEIICAKQRNGALDTVRLSWNGPLMRFGMRLADDGLDMTGAPLQSTDDDAPAGDGGFDA